MRWALSRRFSLLDDKAEDSVIDERLRHAVVLNGATPWVLMFAIFIASIGLNVDSAAVVIGAMPVPPPMGPIVGAVRHHGRARRHGPDERDVAFNYPSVSGAFSARSSAPSRRSRAIRMGNAAGPVAAVPA